MSIKPNVIILQESDSSINALANVYMEQIPQVITNLDENDSSYINMIRCQPSPNEIDKVSISDLNFDISQMVKLLGAYCKTNSIEEIKKVVTSIHNSLPEKNVSIVKNWVNYLTGLHPKIDDHLKTLEYWKKLYSELIGTNNIIYYADTSCIDISFWVKNPLFETNEIVWFTDEWPSPSYIRETVREKLPSVAVKFIQEAGLTCTKVQYRNVVLESQRTTESGTGAEKGQSRPIGNGEVHGSSLNNDWYNQSMRTMPEVKEAMFNYAINHLDDRGVFVHVLVNHMQPLVTDAAAEKSAITFSDPIGVEETFPRANTSITIDTDLNGNRILRNPTSVDNDSLKPIKES